MGGKHYAELLALAQSSIEGGADKDRTAKRDNNQNC
jgi:hypothetical protein